MVMHMEHCACWLQVVTQFGVLLLNGERKVLHGLHSANNIKEDLEKCK